MVLMRALCVLLAVAGCNQSLFDAHGGGDGGGGDGGGDDDAIDVPDRCEARCLGDAAANFIDTSGAWRYLEDRRDRTWRSMDAGAGLVSGLDGGAIRRCADAPSNAACQALPDALFVSSSGAGSASAPALEFTVREAAVVKLAFRAHVTAPHQILLYRNGRPDALATLAALPGGEAKAAILVDALPDDRFLLAFEPTEAGASGVALHFYVSATDAPFPSSCQLAILFSDRDGNTVADSCGSNALTSLQGGIPAPPIPDDDPFGKPDSAGFLDPEYHFEAAQALARGSRVTIQLWTRYDGFADEFGWVFSDLEPSGISGGIGIRFRPTPTTLEVAVVDAANPLQYSLGSHTYTPAIPPWHFVRVVYANDTVVACLDGKQVISFPHTGAVASSSRPLIGRGRREFDNLHRFAGVVDDVRVFSEALPCE